MILKEHLLLLMQREGRVVLGRHAINLWLLTLVLIATFVAVAFSNGSLIFLSDKMNDPFTNWVNITNEFGSGRVDELREDLARPEIQTHYLFSDVQADNYGYMNMIGRKGIQQFKCRFFGSMQTGLVSMVLDEQNVVSHGQINPQNIRDRSLGFIITSKALENMGYSTDSIPPYIGYAAYSSGADSLGLKMIEDFVCAPVPVLAVVKRLPMNMDMIASRYFYEQQTNDMTHPFNMAKESSQQKLCFFVKKGVANFEEVASQVADRVLPDSLNKNIEFYTTEEELQSMLLSWMPGEVKTVYVDERAPTVLRVRMCEEILSHFSDLEVTRVYDYEVQDRPSHAFSFLSVNFVSLDSIRAFGNYASNNFGVSVEMSQVYSKENFNAVSVMANILSSAMIVFSIICIIIFIVNMLQSYFQKVKRNLGTFKAFGISSSELTMAYSLILAVIVVMAIVIALLFTWLLQLMLPELGIMKDGEYNYLSLWGMKTIWTIVVIAISTMLTVVVVLHQMLKHTPGDLIYDR